MVKRLVGFITAFMFGLGILVAPTLAPADSKVGESATASAAVKLVANRSWNEGSVKKKGSVKYLFAYDSKGKITIVKPGKYIPYKTKKISTPSGYIAVAWNGFRGYQCATYKPYVLKKANRKWTILRATAKNKKQYCRS